MHHAHITGHFIPIKFRYSLPKVIDSALKEIQSMDVNYILSNYHKPFHNSFHAYLEFDNVRLKEDSLFEKNYFGIIHREKFKEKYNIYNRK